MASCIQFYQSQILTLNLGRETRIYKDHTEDDSTKLQTKSVAMIR